MPQDVDFSFYISGLGNKSYQNVSTSEEGRGISYRNSNSKILFVTLKHRFRSVMNNNHIQDIVTSLYILKGISRTIEGLSPENENPRLPHVILKGIRS